MSAKEKPRITLELETGDYLVSVHPSGSYAWKHRGDGTFEGHGVKIKKGAVTDALQQLRLNTRRELGLDDPITRYHESRGIEDLTDLFTVTRGAETLRCALRTQPSGWELRIVGEPNSEAPAVFTDEGDMLSAAWEWKEARLREGWVLTAARVRLLDGTYDVAWNLIPVKLEPTS
jgi:hypothetical protein